MPRNCTDEDSRQLKAICGAYLIEEAVRRRHVWRLNGAIERIHQNQLHQLFFELTAYEANSDAVPGTVRTPLPPSNRSIAWE